MSTDSYQTVHRARLIITPKWKYSQFCRHGMNKLWHISTMKYTAAERPIRGINTDGYLSLSLSLSHPPPTQKEAIHERICATPL